MSAFTGKTALVTGANKGIGYEAVRQLANKGFTVYLGARDTVRGEAAAAALATSGLDVRHIALEVTDEASIAAAAKTIEAAHGSLDVLVNNAGVNVEFTSDTQQGLSLDQLRRTYEVNVFGLFAALRGFQPLIEAAKGRIINVSSTLGSLSDQSNPESAYFGLVTPAYNSSKTAVNALTVAYAKLLGPKGVSVNAICPGWVKTDMGSDAAPRTVDQGAAIITHLATIGTPPNGAFVDENGTVAW